jgi:hypothetical protein
VPPSPISKKVKPQSSAGAIGFALQAMFSLGFLVLCQTVYQVIGWCNAIDAVDKSDWPALPCPLDVRVPAANLVEKYHSWNRGNCG